MLKINNRQTNDFLIRQLPTATLFINQMFEVVHVSDRWISYFELDTLTVLGKPIQEILTQIDSRWELMLQNCLAGRRDESLVYLNEDSECGTTWFELTCVPWYDERENIVGLIIEAEDITQKTLLEDEYNKLRSLLKTTSEIGKIGYWEYCFTTDKLSWCSMTRKIHEVSESFVPEMDSAVQFYKDGHSKNTISMVIHQAMTHGTGWSERLKILTAKGNEIWVQASGMPIYEGDKLIGLTGTFQNIDEQVRSEIKITESEIRMRTLIDNLPLNVFIKDTESRKILVNKAECEFLGVKNPDELLGKTNFDVFEPEIAQKLTNQDLKVMETLIPLLSHENIIQKKNGETVTFLTSKIPLLDDTGKSNGLIGISMNISELKQKEEELRNLVHVTSLQNKKLVNFAHIVSHNLRSHTANFSMLLDFLTNEQDESEKENIMGMLTDASDNLLETLENLNEVVDINTNVNVDKKSILLKRKIDHTIQNLSAYLKTNKATIINKVSKTQKVKVIPAYIDTILMNFITNAVKYKNPNRDAIIILATTIEENYTVLSITDNGLGIDLEKYGHKIFGMYKTFHNHDDARGIGLYIAKNQIEAMNGKVSVHSTVGVGTTFKIYFNEKN